VYVLGPNALEPILESRAVEASINVIRRKDNKGKIVLKFFGFITFLLFYKPSLRPRLESGTA
jgi:hypothetical protein